MVKIEIENKLYDLPEITLRKLDPKCLKEGHLCALMGKSHICFQPIKQRKNGDFVFANLAPCCKNPDIKIQINEVVKHD
ncbi:MAG: hypothetical protein ABSF65_05590 [Candidatus Bathyarchaeia archaeon]|jgi:hypothetical protein